MSQRILVAGIGNIFLGDDAFGCEVAQRLLDRPWPEDIRIVDFGIRGLDLAYALMDEYETAILVDATPQGNVPGSVYVMELNLEDAGEWTDVPDAHGMHPLNVMRMVRSLGGTTGRILLVGCEPGDCDLAEDIMVMTEPVRLAVTVAVERIEHLIHELLEEPTPVMAAMGQEESK